MQKQRLEIGIAGRIFNRNSFSWLEQLALGLNLEGAVFSRPDGSIRVTAEGQTVALELFASKVKKAEVFTRIENFFIRWEPA
ncbi:hypothetical protein A3G06_01515, partial [Candidatus Nomurabacteria bacterium RIFCSPLOWO2_12_FULL_46_14]